MILLFFTVPIIIFLILIYFLSYLKWKENNKIEAIARNKNHKLFQDLKVSSFSKGKLKSIMGFEVKAKLFLIDDRLIITSEKMDFKLFHTILPVIIENKKGTVMKVKMTNWKSIHLTFQKNTFSLGKANTDLTIKTNNKDQQLAIYNEIKGWT